MISKTLNYVWLGRNPKLPICEKCIASWKKFAPDYKLVEWNEDNFDMSSLPRCMKDAYALKRYDMVSDYVRLKIIYDNGGLYFDTDAELLKPIPEEWLAYPAFFGIAARDNEPYHSVATGLGFGAEKHSPIVKEVLRNYDDDVYGKFQIWPRLSNVFRDTPTFARFGFTGRNERQVLRDGTLLLPREYLEPATYFDRELNTTENTVAIHWYTAVMRYGIASKNDITVVENSKGTNMESKQHTLTIVMICHNDVSHLKRSIVKIKDTIQPGVRLLFVDDCSDDGSFELASALVEGIGTAIQTQTIRNVGGARNFGIEYLNSLPDEEKPEYIWFHDCDDYISDDGIKRIMETLVENDGVDCISLPIGTLRNAMSEGKVQPTLYQSAVAQANLYDAANSPVGAWSKVFKLSKYVPNAEGQMCEHVAWHYRQFDQFDSWAKVTGETPCYIWDRTNDKAISETVDFCDSNSNTIEGLAFSNILVQRGLKDRWVSDCLRNLANMYDVRHELKKPYVRDCWAIRFRQECANIMGGHFVH